VHYLFYLTETRFRLAYYIPLLYFPGSIDVDVFPGLFQIRVVYILYVSPLCVRILLLVAERYTCSGDVLYVLLRVC
jgi:hypothetical protein